MKKLIQKFRNLLFHGTPHAGYWLQKHLVEVETNLISMSEKTCRTGVFTEQIFPLKINHLQIIHHS